MNIFINELSRICRENLLEEKWLVSQSLRVGHQWLETVTRSGQPVANCRVVTPKSLALEIIGEHLAAEGLILVSGRGARIIMDRLWRRIKKGGSGYLSSLPEGTGQSRMICSSVASLRMAGLDPRKMKREAFENPTKAREITMLLEAWSTELERMRLVDYADVLKLALKSVREGDMGAGGIFILPAETEFGLLEKRLFDAFPRERLLEIPTGPGLERNIGEEDGAAIPFRLTSDARHPKAGLKTDIFRAVGEINEVREVLRRCLDQRLNLDDVEILHTAMDTYVPMIYESFFRVLPPEMIEGGELPVTFAEGIPAGYTRPGRALLAWLEWIRGDFRQSALVRMIKDGLLKIEGMTEAGFSYVTLAGILGMMPIGFGRARYRQKMDAYAAKLEKQIRRPGADEDDVESCADKRMKSRRLEGARILNKLIGRLLAGVPVEGSGAGEFIKAAGAFLEKYSRSVSAMDNFAREALLREMDDLMFWIEGGRGGGKGEKREDGFDRDPGLPAKEAAMWLLSLPQEVRIAGSGPRPGAVHVAHILSGGHSGRSNTFIIGLDEGRFPGAGLQDPIILDRERMKLSGHLPTSGAGLRRNVNDFRRLISRLEGRLTLGFSCQDLVEDREMFPSPVVLEVFRKESGKPDADQGDLFSSMPPPSSFAPERADRSLDEPEWWLWRLTGPEEITEPRDLVTERFPHLGRGLEARERRLGGGFTKYDGHVPEAGVDHDPTSADGPVVSSSRLESLARCPLCYYFKYILGLAPPEETTPGPEQWLDHLQFGSLLHEVLHDFMAALLEKDSLPSAGRDAGLMKETVKRLAARYRERYPPLTESSYRAQYRRLEKAAMIFLVEEEEFCRRHRPKFLEASIGMPPGDRVTAFDTPEPMEFCLPGGKTIRVRGRIDRIDEEDQGPGRSFLVTDYKSGSPFLYLGPDPIRQGRIIQPALYMAMAEERLREIVSPDASVSRFRYFFPDARQRGEEIVRTPDMMAPAGKIIRNLCMMAASGCFPATDNPALDKCEKCDYRSLCRIPGHPEPAVTRKLDNPLNTVLEPFRILRGRKKDDE